ncbi:hypothetical protein HK405_011846 [Cladochytrium tenue]|nr:hypothetical protein HK405_011846 [Cladochytrium tenue]
MLPRTIAPSAGTQQSSSSSAPVLPDSPPPLPSPPDVMLSVPAVLLSASPPGSSSSPASTLSRRRAASAANAAMGTPPSASAAAAAGRLRAWRPPRPRNVMVALDGSLYASRALDWALRNVVRDGDRVLLASVAAFPGSWGEFLSQAFRGASANSDKVRAMQSQAEEHVLKTLMDAAAAANLAGDLAPDDPAAIAPDAAAAADRPPRVSVEILPVVDPAGSLAPPAAAPSLSSSPYSSSPATAGGALPASLLAHPHPKHVLARLCRDREVDLLVRLLAAAAGSGSP